MKSFTWGSDLYNEWSSTKRSQAPPAHGGQHRHVYPNDSQPEVMLPCTVSVRLRDISPLSDWMEMPQYFQRWQPILADCNLSVSSKGRLVIAKIVVCQTGTEFCVVLHHQCSFCYIPEYITINVHEVLSS